jgi:hypothetical protein
MYCPLKEKFSLKKKSWMKRTEKACTTLAINLLYLEEESRLSQGPWEANADETCCDTVPSY